jgi:hypothetical protein
MQTNFMSIAAHRARQLLLVMLLVSMPIVAYGEDRKEAAEQALAEVLFEFDVIAAKLATEVSDNGVISLQHTGNVDQEELARLITRLKSHPRVNGVNASVALDVWDEY